MRYSEQFDAPISRHGAPYLFIQIGPRIRVGGTLGQIGEGIKKVAAPVVGAAISKIPIVGDIYNGAKSLLDHVPGVQGAEDFLKGNGGQNALTAAQAVNAALLGKKSSDFADNAMGSVQANWDERAPLRTAGQAGMLNPGQGIAARIAAVPNRNPYASHAPVPGAAPSIGPAVPFGPGQIDGSPESLQKLHGGFLGHVTPKPPPFADGSLDGSPQSLQSIHGGFLGHVTPSLGPARNG